MNTKRYTTPFRMKVNEKRNEEIIIAMLEWAIEVSEDVTRDLIRASGITSEELEEIGYEKENFPKMHEWANN